MMNSENVTGKFYGWKIVFAILFILTFVSGLSFYNHAVILNALSLKPQFSIQSVSLAVSIFFLSGGFAGLWVAKLLQDFDPRFCICIGAIFSAAALTSLGFVESIWQLYLAYIFFGVGFSASGLIPGTTLVTRWFHTKRAMALSIASTGLSLGGVVITPVCALLVETFGLNKAAPIMGAMYILGVVPVALIWLRPHPQYMGQQADGVLKMNGENRKIANTKAAVASNKDEKPFSDEDVPHDDAPDFDKSVSFSDAYNGKFFWCLSVSYIFVMMAQVGGIAHQYGLVRELITQAQSALILAILPVASIVGRLVGGWVIEKMSIRIFAILMMLGQVISLACLATGFSVVTLCIGLALFGATVGNLLMLQPLIIAEAYGIKDYARIFSLSNLLTSFGTACGPALLGYIYVVSENQYSVAYVVAALAGLLGLLLFVGGGRVKQSRRVSQISLEGQAHTVN
ncbi:MAG: MFS family permease [Gammaproteobacteria bacterium]|jgi:MFS family permease